MADITYTIPFIFHNDLAIGVAKLEGIIPGPQESFYLCTIHAIYIFMR